MPIDAKKRAAVLSSHMTGDSLPPVLARKSGAVTTITLNRTEKLNSLSLEMIRLLAQAYYAAIEDTSSRCVVMRGEGKAFSAGGDVAAVREQALTGGPLPYDFFYEEYMLNHTIATMFERHGLPQIALWDGITMGGGVGLSVHGKFRVATEKTLFAKPETKIGLFPDVGGTHVLSRLRGGMPVGLLIGLTGIRLRAADCLWSGLATHFLPSARIPELMLRLQAMSPVDVGDASLIDKLLLELRGDAMPDLSKAELEPHAAAIMRCFGASTAEEILVLLDAEKEDREWAAKTAKVLRSMSPTSVKLTMEGMKRSTTLNIGEALAMEYRMAERCVLRPQPQSDFYEGIRAVLVDKDNNPSYLPKTLEEVHSVESFFAPLEAGHPRGELPPQTSYEAMRARAPATPELGMVPPTEAELNSWGAKRRSY